MMDRAKIEQVCLSLEEPMLETLKTMVRIPSVKGEAEPDAPFGTPARQALDKALEICGSLGSGTASCTGAGLPTTRARWWRRCTR